jgi:Fur family ferric uptake transcriptional regulator
MRRTKQRQAILNQLVSADGPLSVNEVYERASAELPGLGMATVYRTLKALKEGGEISVVELPGEDPRYEAAGLGHHHHFRCLSCTRTFDLGVCPVGIPRGTTLPGGFSVEHHSLTLYGRCPACPAS